MSLAGFRTSLSVGEHRYKRPRILNVSHKCNLNKSRKGASQKYALNGRSQYNTQIRSQ